MMRILIVEDAQDMNLLIAKTLKKSGYSVDRCFNGEEALDFLLGARYDAMILDVMMPKMDGYTLLQQIRDRNMDLPVLFLTARDAIADRVKGLDLGADDYLVKPFSFDELIARIHAVTRTAAGNPGNTYSLADLTLDVKTHTVTRGGREITLTAKEYSLLEFLLRNKNQVLSRQKIEDNVWNFDYGGGTNIVDVYIKYLRKKIDEGFPVRLIHTVRGVGYILKEGEAKENN